MDRPDTRELIAWALVVFLTLGLVTALVTRPDGGGSSESASSSDEQGDERDGVDGDESDDDQPTDTAGSSIETTTQPPFGSASATTVGPTATTSRPQGSTSGALNVGPGQDFATLQDALNAAAPGDVVTLATAGVHKGPAKTSNAGSEGSPITLTAVDGARLDCGEPDDGEVARCLSIFDPYYVLDGFAVTGGSSNVYLQGEKSGEYVHDVVIKNSVFRGLSGTGECIRVKYQAFRVEIAHNDIADCGLDKCCNDNKNGEAVYIGTAPEQLVEKNPSSEPDETHDVWVHHNVMAPYNECVDIKEAAYANLVEHNTCSNQSDDDSGAFGSRGGTVGKGNIFRFNLITDAEGACARFGGDEEDDGTGNDFYGNTCRDISGENGVKQMTEPQGVICGNVFEGGKPDSLSRQEGVDPTAACPGSVDMAGAANPGAG